MASGLPGAKLPAGTQDTEAAIANPVSTVSARDYSMARDDSDVEISRGTYVCAGCWCGVISILLLILLPLTFVSLEYYEYGLVQRRSTGAVYLDKGVYYGGRHALGPDMTFRRFPADAHIVHLSGIDAVSADKLSTLLDVDFVYFINRDEVIALKQELDRNYDPVVQATAIAAIKNAAVQFETLAYFHNRSLIEQSFFDALTAQVRPLHVLVPFLYLSGVRIPPQVASKQLQTAVQGQNNLQQVFSSQAALTRRTTDQLVNQIDNNATLTLQAAAARADQIVKNAQASAQQTIDTARNAGLQLFYQATNITTAKHKASADYILTLTKAGNAGLHIGYQTKLAVVGQQAAV